MPVRTRVDAIVENTVETRAVYRRATPPARLARLQQRLPTEKRAMPSLLQRGLLLAAALFASTACAPLGAQPLVQMAVVDRDSGQWLPEYRHHGRRWIAG